MTTPCEKLLWSDEDLSEFKIVPNQITRIYHIQSWKKFRKPFPIKNFLMAVRVKYEGRDVYVELAGFNKLDDPDTSPRGTIYISEDVSLFLEVVQTTYFQLRHIQKSLTEDGIVLDKLDSRKVKEAKIAKNIGKMEYINQTRFLE